MKYPFLRPLLVFLPFCLMSFVSIEKSANDFMYADVNKDGEINISDVNAVIDAIFGIPTPPPPPETKTFFVNGVPFTMVKVVGGTFLMGATQEQDPDVTSPDEYPVDTVTLSSYYIGQTEVTHELWQAVMDTLPSRFTDDLTCPVEKVTWDQCREFIRKLNMMTGLQFRFPTEAEWEFAARGGNLSQGYVYSGSNNINEVGWWGNEKGGNSHYGTYPVGYQSPNELGIYDMTGNVFEWCNDWFDDYPSNGYVTEKIDTIINNVDTTIEVIKPRPVHLTNPKGPSVGIYRVMRGGAWSSEARFCRLSYRYSKRPDFYSLSLGLRLAM